MQFAAGPSLIGDAAALVRLAKASAGRIDLRADPGVLAEWQELHPVVAPGEATLSQLRPRTFDAATIPTAVDGCLVRLLDARIAEAVANGGSAPIGIISGDILAPAVATWAHWRAALTGDHFLRYDFLRWLADVVQDRPSPWKGDHAHLQSMCNALLMTLATHLGEPLAPTCDKRGNLAFGTDAIALGSGCEAIGLESISVRQRPEDWDVEALILSGSGDVVLQNAGSVRDGGKPSTGMMTAKRVAPAIVQRSPFWRSKLAGGLVVWKDAIAQEFEALRDRQNDAVQEISS